MPLDINVIIPIIILVITIPLGALMLFLSGKIFKEEISYSKAIIATLIIVFVDFVLKLIGPLSGNPVIIGIMGIIGFLVSLALYLILPKAIFNLEWKKGLLIGLVWFLFMLVVAFFLAIVVFYIAITIGFSTNMTNNI